MLIVLIVIGLAIIHVIAEILNCVQRRREHEGARLYSGELGSICKHKHRYPEEGRVEQWHCAHWERRGTIDDPLSCCTCRHRSLELAANSLTLFILQRIISVIMAIFAISGVLKSITK
jgi:hypothetical protein